MRIGIDLQVLAQKNLTGVGKYALNITHALLDLKSEHEFILFIPETSSWSSPYEEGKGEVVVLPKRTIPFWTNHATYARIMRNAKLDILFGPANTTPWFYLDKTVVTVHDLAIYKHPEWFPKGQSFSVKHLVPRSIKRAAKIIVPSLATKSDLLDLFQIPKEKVEVIPHGVEGRFFEAEKAKFHTQNPQYILFVGTLEPRKNVKRLIEAYELLPEDIRSQYEIWIAGAPSPLIPLSERGRVGERGRIRFLGYVPDEQLPALYANARAFVYPSLYEGFGMPVLEGLAAGVPVVTSNTSSLPEVIGEAGTAVDPRSSREIADALSKLIRDEAYSSQISRKGIARASEFTWDVCAKRTLRVLSKLPNMR